MYRLIKRKVKGDNYEKLSFHIDEYRKIFGAGAKYRKERYIFMKYTVSDGILDGSRKIWDGYHDHPFVKGIADGTLPIEKFKYFMIQDYLYLLEYAKVFSIGAAKAQDPKIQSIFSGYVSQILSGEMDIHKGYMKRLGISMDEVYNTRMAQDNLSYTSYMLRIAYEYGPAHVCAAILPCAVSYETIAKKMVGENPLCSSHPFYGEWINGYASDDYHNENEELKEITEYTSAGLGEDKIKELVQIGERCSLYEGSFWDMSWEMRR